MSCANIITKILNDSFDEFVQQQLEFPRMSFQSETRCVLCQILSMESSDTPMLTMMANTVIVALR